MIFRGDGTLHPGPRADWNPWTKELGSPSGVFMVTDPALGLGAGEVLQIGDFRIAARDSSARLSVSHSSGHTCEIYASDGTRLAGPTPNWNAWTGVTAPPPSPP